MEKFKFKLDERVIYKNSICVVIGRAQYIVRTNDMYMLQDIKLNVEFEVDVTKAFWVDETEIEKDI